MPITNAARGSFTPEQAYTLDAVGIYIYRNFLSQQEVDHINNVITKHLAGLNPPPSKFNFFEIDPIFMDIISRPWVVDAARATVGDRFRMDHVVGIQQPGHIRSAKTGQWVEQGYVYGNIHGGWHSSQGSCFFYSTETRMFSGHMTVGIFLTDQGPNTGGFCYIPGSHKQSTVANGADIFKEILKSNYEHQAITVPHLKKGDLVFFPESLMHGATPLKVKHLRRAIYFKFLPGFMAWRDPKEIESYMHLAKTDIQRQMLRPPYCANIHDKEDARMSDNFYKTTTA